MGARHVSEGWLSPSLTRRAPTKRYAKISVIALALGSPRWIGWPATYQFFVGSSPSARKYVWNRCPPWTSRSVTAVPFSLVLPTTAPPLMPQPPAAIDHAFDQWSRP